MREDLFSVLPIMCLEHRVADGIDYLDLRRVELGLAVLVVWGGLDHRVAVLNTGLVVKAGGCLKLLPGYIRTPRGRLQSQRGKLATLFVG